MKSLTLLVLIVVLCGARLAPAADVEVDGQIKEALDRLYNFDFEGAHRILNAHIAEQPDDPVGPGIRAAAYLFYELDRLAILESKFFEDDNNLSSKTKLKPDPQIRDLLMDALDQTEELAKARLEKNPNDVNALFALCLKEGILTDYKALVERKGLTSLKNAKTSNKYAVRLLQIQPDFYDANLTTGVNEYLIGSLPFFVKWFVKMDGVDGSKDQAFTKLKLVAEKGEYLGPFAKILLSIICLREDQPEKARDLLMDLSKHYPENPLLRKELARVTEELARGSL